MSAAVAPKTIIRCPRVSFGIAFRHRAFVSYSLVQAIGSRERPRTSSTHRRHDTTIHHRHSSLPATTTTADEEARRLPRLSPKDALQHFRLGIDVEYDLALDLRPCAQDLSDLQKDLY